MRNLIGADPELFLMDTKAGRVASAIGVLEGTKEKPEKVGNGALHKDNVLAEINIKPTNNSEKFSGNLLEMMEELRVRANAKGLDVVFPAYAYMHEDYLATAEALVFGCEPDYNAWELEENPPVNPDDAGSLRVAAGHVHISLPKVTPKTQLACAQWCDIYLGIPALFADPDDTRRKLYGRAGSFRPKPYGIEYRVLSNFWLTSRGLMEWVWRQANKAAINSAANHAVDDPEIINMVCNAINNYDVQTAEHICKLFGQGPLRHKVDGNKIYTPYTFDAVHKNTYLKNPQEEEPYAVFVDELHTIEAKFGPGNFIPEEDEEIEEDEFGDIDNEEEPEF